MSFGITLLPMRSSLINSACSASFLNLSLNVLHFFFLWLWFPTAISLAFSLSVWFLYFHVFSLKPFTSGSQMCANGLCNTSMFSLSLQTIVMVERKRFLQLFVCKNCRRILNEFWLNEKLTVLFEMFTVMFSNFGWSFHLLHLLTTSFVAILYFIMGALHTNLQYLPPRLGIYYLTFECCITHSTIQSTYHMFHFHLLILLFISWCIVIWSLLWI